MHQTYINTISKVGFKDSGGRKIEIGSFRCVADVGRRVVADWKIELEDSDSKIETGGKRLEDTDWMSSGCGDL